MAAMARARFALLARGFCLTVRQGIKNLGGTHVWPRPQQFLFLWKTKLKCQIGWNTFFKALP